MAIYTDITARHDLKVVERRSSHRLRGSFKAILRRRNGSGKHRHEAIMRNLSSYGCYLQTTSPVRLNEELLVVTEISNSKLALRGTALRIEPLQDERCGVVIAIGHYRFI